MDQPYFEDPNWYRAITLTERIASLRAVQRLTLDIEINAELASQRLQRWRSQLPFSTGDYFAQRLAMDRMTEDDLYYLLSEPIEAVHGRFPAPPAWLVDLAQAFSRSAASNALPLPEQWRGQEAIAFLDMIAPLISQSCARLHQGVQALVQTRSYLPFDPGTVEEIMFANLPGQLLRMLTRTMVLELHMARLQGFLKGDTSEERFREASYNTSASPTPLSPSYENTQF